MTARPGSAQPAIERVVSAAVWRGLALGLAVLWLAGCGAWGRGAPTRTPIPTFTPTPIVVVAPAGSDASTSVAQTAIAVSEQATAQASLPTPQPAPTATDTPAPPTDTPEPTLTPTPAPSATPTVEPTATSTPNYRFTLEAAEKFPTESLAPNVVRVYAYIYSPAEFALGGYSLRVTHNGADLPVDQASSAGLPRVTRKEPGPYSRFTNLTKIFVEAQAGDWVVQLVDEDGNVVGPPATFQLSANEDTRELYVRYVLDVAAQ